MPEDEQLVAAGQSEGNIIGIRVTIGLGGDIETMEEELWHRVLDINPSSAMLRGTAYSASKAGMIAMTNNSPE